jgi:putative DNA primase/helicase
MMPDPSERKFYVTRLDLNADRSVSKITALNALTGVEVDERDSANWRPFEEAKALADAWGVQEQSPLVVYGVRAVVSAPAVDPYTRLVDRTDAGNANLLIHLADGNLRYVHETKQWLRWTGARWHLDEHETFVTGQALEVAKHYLQYAQGIRKGEYRLTANGTVEDSEEIFKWAVKCRSKGHIEAMITLARKVPGVPISVNDLDRNPWLLGVDNGVVDLRTGQLHETEARDEYVTKRCPIRYNPAAQAARWERFIIEITGAPITAEHDTNGGVITQTVGRFTSRPALAQYLQKALGYSITGATHEQKFFLAIGPGSNGKNVVFEAVKRVLGRYANVLPAEALMATSRPADPERPTALAASLAGARFALASESKDEQKLDVGLIKNHTGDEEMTARRMRQDPITFKITHKLWLMTNNRPDLDHIDAAIRGRLHLVPFDRRWNRPGEFERDPTLPDGDKMLGAQLATESEGILAWLVRGALLYQAEGLNPPAEVVALTNEYVQEQDHLGQWLATLQRCPPEDGWRASDLFAQFAQWCGAQGCEVKPKNQTAFGLALGKRGIAQRKWNDGKHYGLRGVAGAASAATRAFGDQPPPLPPGVVPVPPATKSVTG